MPSLSTKPGGTHGDFPIATPQRWLAAIAELTDLLAVARGLGEAAPELLRTMARLGEFAHAALWTRDTSTDGWARLRSWVRDLASDPSRGREPSLAGPDSLVARACALRRTVTSSDVAAGADAGSESTVVIPILHGEECFGALSLTRAAPVEMDGAESAAAGALGRQIGQFVARESAFQDLAANRRVVADLFENAPVGLHLMDCDGKLLRVNRAEMEILGCSREELVGRAWRDFHVDPPVADEMLAKLCGVADPARRASEGPRPNVEGEVRLRRRDGTQRWARVEANVRRDGDKIVHVRMFVRDVTAARDAQVALADSEERYRRLVEGARDYALHGLDLEGRVTTWNLGAERLFGYRAADVLGQDFSLSMTIEDRADDVSARILQLAADEGEFRHEGWRVRKDGSQFWAEVVYSAMRDDVGSLVGISQLSRDVSERRRLEAQRRKSADLEAANREVLDSARRREALLESVTAAIEGPAGEIQRAAAALPADSSEAATAHRRLDAAVARLLEGIEGLQGLARRTATAHANDSEALELARVASEVRDLLAELAAERRVRVEVDLDPGLGEVLGEPERLRLVVYNLLSHAIRASRDRGRAVLRIVGEGKSRYRIEVHDSGLGLSPERAASLFADPAEGEVGDREMGLVATRRIVEEHGGRVSVQTSIGHGTVLAAVLPRRPIAAASRPVLHAADGGSAPRVLVVAEDPATRAGLAWALGHGGFEHVLAGSPAEGIQSVAEDRFDAIAVDLMLEEGGAVDLVASVRRAGASRDASWILAAAGTPGAGLACCAVADLLPSPTPADRMFAALERRHVPRGRGTTIVVGDSVEQSREGALRTLRLLGYEARGEEEGEACLRLCSEVVPGAVLISPSLGRMGAFSFARHLRAVPELERTPLFLMCPKDLGADEADALRHDALASLGDRSWENCLRSPAG